MSKKYNKITTTDVLSLFAGKEMITRKDITDKYNCSVYSVIQIIEQLIDGKQIKLSNHGYKRIK